jgi:acetyl-CoA carboxylase carboxyltransferase component
MEEHVEELRRRKEHLREGGNKKLQERLRQQGMLLARERIDKLVDPGTFVETDMFLSHHNVHIKKEIPCEGVITGYAEIDGRPVYVFSQDFSAQGGTMGRWTAKKMCKLMDMAYYRRCPVIGINHGSGARFQDHLGGDLGGGVGFGNFFYKIALYSGVIPQIGLFMGDNAGGGVYGPGMDDFVIATKQSNLFISGPGPVKSVVGEDVTPEQLGSAKMHATVSGCVHVLAEDDIDCLEKTRKLLSFLPLNNREAPPVSDTGDDPNRLCPELHDVVPVEPRRVYDMHKVIKIIVDSGDFFEVHKDYVKNIITGFARFAGQPVGIIASNPMHLAGAITEPAARKAARFVRFCDLFNIPVVYLIDSPGYMIGTEQERLGILTRGTTFLFATSEATVPLVTVVIRKMVAAAQLTMGSLALHADIVFAWPIADTGAIDPQALAKIIYVDEIRSAENPEEVLRKRTEETEKEIGNIYDAASWQNVTDVIEPAETRLAIIRGLKMTKNKMKPRPEKKYSNIPL